MSHSQLVNYYDNILVSRSRTQVPPNALRRRLHNNNNILSLSKKDYTVSFHVLEDPTATVQHIDNMYIYIQYYTYIQVKYHRGVDDEYKL